MKVKPEKKHRMDCDRCGIILCSPPAALKLERPIEWDTDWIRHDEYSFKLCPRCARKLFAWVGDAKEVKP